MEEDCGSTPTNGYYLRIKTELPVYCSRTYGKEFAGEDLCMIVYECGCQCAQAVGPE